MSLASFVLLAIPITVWDFAVSDHGLVHYGATNQWEYGVPTSGPGGAQALWATGLGGNYLNDSTDHLELELPDVTGFERPTLVIRHWYAFGPGDGGWLEIEDSGGWHLAEPTYGYPTATWFTGTQGWVETTVPLDGPSPVSRLRFAFASDAWLADDGWYVSRVALYDGDVTEPYVQPMVWPSDTQELAEPYTVRAKVFDDVALQSVRLVWTTPAGGGSVAMQPLGADLFEGSIPPQPPDTHVTWHVEATDHVGNLASVPSTPSAFRVFLGAPRALRATVTGRAVGQEVQLTWLPPVTPHPVLGYLVQDVHGALEPYVAPQPPMDLRLVPGVPTAWRVAAIYDPGVGDWSDTLHLDVEQPSLARLEPASGLQGQTFHLRLEGGSLYLLDGHSTLTLGDGLRVLELDVLDVGTLEAWVAIDEGALPGPRDVVVGGVHGTATFPEAFEVFGADSALHVVYVSPPSLRQGQITDVVVELSEAIGSEVTVHADEALLVHGPPVVDDRTITLPLAVGASARPGRYAIVLDDGASRVSVAIDVVERQIGGVQRACSHGGSVGPVGLLAGLLALARRRRGGRSGASPRSVRCEPR